VPSDEVDNLLQVLYFIHLHLSCCVALNSVQYYKMAPYVFLKTFLVIHWTIHCFVSKEQMKSVAKHKEDLNNTINRDE
jgi:hypothetical protein